MKSKRHLPRPAVAWAVCLAVALPAQADPARAKRLKWWREARLGLLVRWGPEAQLQGGKGPWGIERVGWDRYDAQAKTFNPVKHKPENFALVAKAAGAKYVLLTVKQHDGFCMWDTKHTDHNVMNTPYGKDVLAGFCQALRKEGLRVGVYFSAWDWRRKEFGGVPKEARGLMQRRAGVGTEEGNRQWPEFLDFYLGQVAELLSNYGRIDVLWIDGRQTEAAKKWASDRFYKLVRAKQPDVMLNDRWGDPDRADFVTFENRLPQEEPPRPWEAVVPTTGEWSWHFRGSPAPAVLVRKLIQAVATNGNLLLNVTPGPDGTWHGGVARHLRSIGAWLKINGESIYGCGPAPLRCSPWGLATARRGHVYLHVFGDCHDPGRPVVLADAAGLVRSARLLAGKPLELKVTAKDGDAVLALPAKIRIDPAATVIDVTARRS